MPRIAVAGFQHETNTFGATLAGFAEFEEADAWPPLLMGADVVSGTAGINLPIAGFIAAASREAGVDLVPIVWASAEPSSFVTDDAFDRIAGMIIDGITGAGAIDGLYLDLHGAMVTQSHHDGEGEVLDRIRGVVGDGLPIAVSLDLHANISDRMARLATSMAIFRTYPHIDMADTGARSWKLLQRHLSGEPCFKAFRQAPFLVPLSAQYTGAEPCASLYALLDDAGNGVASSDIAMGFTAADIADAGPSIVAHGLTQADADAEADRLMAAFEASEAVFDSALVTPGHAVALAMAEPPGKPVVIADVQDNPGAGATSDTTGLLAALIEGKAERAVLALLNDPKTAAAAHAAGVGATLETDLGGVPGYPDLPPYPGRFAVEALSDGIFPFTGAMYGGSTADLGPTAVLRVVDTGADVRVVVGSKRCQCVDQAIFTHIGIEPAAERIVAVKSTVHFRADFEPIAAKVVNAEAPGLNPCRLDGVPYRHLRPGVRIGPLGRTHR